MYHVALANIIHADREREIEEAIRTRNLLKPRDEAIETNEAHEVRDRGGNDPRTLSPRVRPTGG